MRTYPVYMRYKCIEALYADRDAIVYIYIICVELYKSRLLMTIISTLWLVGVSRTTKK
jgi:hypothetical protein